MAPTEKRIHKSSAFDCYITHLNWTRTKKVIA